MCMCMKANVCQLRKAHLPRVTHVIYPSCLHAYMTVT